METQNKLHSVNWSMLCVQLRCIILLDMSCSIGRMHVSCIEQKSYFSHANEIAFSKKDEALAVCFHVGAQLVKSQPSNKRISSRANLNISWLFYVGCQSEISSSSMSLWLVTGILCSSLTLTFATVFACSLSLAVSIAVFCVWIGQEFTVILLKRMQISMWFAWVKNKDAISENICSWHFVTGEAFSETYV